MSSPVHEIPSPAPRDDSLVLDSRTSLDEGVAGRRAGDRVHGERDDLDPVPSARRLTVEDEVGEQADDDVDRGAYRFQDGKDGFDDLDPDLDPGPGPDLDPDLDRDPDPDFDLAPERDRKRRGARRGGRRRERRAPGGRPARHEVSAERRAELVAAAARIAAGEPAPVSKAARRRRRSRTFNRLAVLVLLTALAAAVSALVAASDPVTPLSRSDADFMSAQLVSSDRHVRGALLRLPAHGSNAVLDRTRDAIATTRSLLIELRNSRGGVADRLRRALALEGAWLDAVGSTLADPRSPLQAQLATRDAALRPALAALPGRGAPRPGAAPRLVDYARSRAARQS